VIVVEVEAFFERHHHLAAALVAGLGLTCGYAFHRMFSDRFLAGGVALGGVGVLAIELMSAGGFAAIVGVAVLIAGVIVFRLYVSRSDRTFT